MTFFDPVECSSVPFAYTERRFSRSWRGFLSKLWQGGLQLCVLLSVTALASGQQPGDRPKEFPIGKLSRVDELPTGRLRTQLESLPPTAQENAIRWLRSFHFTEQDLPSMHVDRSGGILFACGFKEPITGEDSTAEPPQIGQAAVPVSPFPAGLVFHSKPGAANVLYLNFCGETVTGTDWNTSEGRTEIPAVAFSTDSDLTTFSDEEQLVIKRVWERVSEDYAPFNIDVTTERPATFTSRTAHALITRTTDANGDANPSSTAGGVAYINVFGTTAYSRYRPAWIYPENLASTESYIAEAAAHEVGHNMGLSHDGLTGGSEYYGGHGSGDISWAPIMGTGYNRNVSQWSKGEYYLANNTQDDLATVAGKLTYRTDDHGSTSSTATALVITSGTNIQATTPETDPTNSNTANKGVLERTGDLDVFSFVTGSGAVNITASPWIMPSGTRGGNVDLALALVDSSGNLLLSNAPAYQTTATITTNLAEGRYYLHVRSTGAGDPYASSPTGYTVYGGVGQYFITGTVAPSLGYIVPPTAELVVTDVTQSGATNVDLTVTYSDDVGVSVSTIDSSDLRVTGPNGYDSAAQLVSVSASGDGTPRVAIYRVTSPSGNAWTRGDNGTYTVWMQTNQVHDTEGARVAAGQLGEFNVAVPLTFYAANMDSDPGWTLEPDWEYGTPSYSVNGPTSGYTGTKVIGHNLSGNYANNLSAQYATTPAIDCSGATSLGLRFKRWLRTRPNDTVSIQVTTNGTDWVSVWSTMSAVYDTSWREMQYALPDSVAGSATVRIRWGLASNASQNDIGWNIDDVEVFGEGVLDATAPVASLSVADVTMPAAASHEFTVTYTDGTAVQLASIGAGDLAVTGPNGYSNLVDFVGADLPADGSSISGSYAVPAPGGSWDSSDNGIYTIALLGGAVQDTAGNVTAGAILGTFTVSITPPSPGVMEVSPAGGLTAMGVVGGPFSPDAITYTLTNSGESALTWTATTSQDWVELSNTNGTLDTGASTTVTISVGASASLLGHGSYSEAVNFVNTTSGNGDACRYVSLAISSLGQLGVTPDTELSASGFMGGPFSPSSIVYTLTNSGGAALNWTASTDQGWVSLSSKGGSLESGAATKVEALIGSEANSMAPGDYAASVSFSDNSKSFAAYSSQVLLIVKSNATWLTLGVSATGSVLVLSGEPNLPFIVEVSPDLVNWAPVLTNSMGADGSFRFEDTSAAGVDRRYYRARVNP